MSTLEIARLDVHDDAAVAAWHAVYERAERHDRGEHATAWTLPELTAMLRSQRRQRTSTAYVGSLDGSPVVFATAVLPLLDNTSSADLAVVVDPAHRRRGHGSAVLAHVATELADQGRTVLNAEVAWPWSAAQDGAGHAGVEFAARHGFERGNLEVMRVLRLPVAPALLDRLGAVPVGYTVRAWAGAVPEELLGPWAELEASLTTEAPTGDLEVEPEVADTAVVRENEQLLTAQGRTPYRAVALAEDGAAVGYTEVVTTVHEPGRAYQWGTLVRSAHRGHGLGVALKVAALRLLQGEPGPAGPVGEVVTWNAESNRHMVAVNVALGFEPVEWCGMYQRRG